MSRPARTLAGFLRGLTGPEDRPYIFMAAGFAVFVRGVWMVHEPAAYMTAGAGLIVAGLWIGDVFGRASTPRGGR